MSEKLAAIWTLGCRLNQADSALLTDRLSRQGYTLVESDKVDDAEPVALCIINSCCVTQEALRKSRQLSRQLHRRFPEAKIVITGCGVELPEHGFDSGILVRNRDKIRLGEIVEQGTGDTSSAGNEEFEAVFKEEATGQFPFRSRAFIKIQEGCNNFCTYCIVPYVRGRERSRVYEEVIADCQAAIRAGFPELVLTGVNTCAYQDGEHDLCSLLEDICQLEGEFRVRLSSTEPHPGNRKLLDVMAKYPDKVCRFLHLSLQHGSNAVLKRMNRHYTREEYAQFAAEARLKLPGLHLGSDVIVGFPQESDEEFADSLEFVRQMAFANVHIFSYSPRQGTPAAVMTGQVPENVKKNRRLELEKVAEASRKAFAASFINQELPVIFENCDSAGRACGWSDNYIPVRVPENMVELDKIVRLRISPEFLG